LEIGVGFRVGAEVEVLFGHEVHSLWEWVVHFRACGGRCGFMCRHRCK
jgi:hypothetical protein